MDKFILSRLLAEYAEVEGMKIENKIRELKGEPYAYNECDFIARANYIREIGQGQRSAKNENQR